MKSARIRVTLAMAAAITLAAAATSATAAPVSWDINSSASYIRLGLPANTPITLDGTAVTVRLRNASNGNISDAIGGGLRANIDGTIESNFTSSSIQFLSGAHDIYALDSGNFRPNPATFDPSNTNADNPNGQYSNNTSSAHPYGVRAIVAALGGLITAHAAFLAVDDVQFDLGSGSLPLTAGAGPISASSTTLGVTSLGYLDGAHISLIGSQPIPDTYGLPIDFPNATNTLAGSVVDLGGLDRQLTLNINVPIAFDLGDGIVLNGSITGLIVATAVVPEPSTIAMAGVAALGLCFAGRRRFRRA